MSCQNLKSLRSVVISKKETTIPSYPEQIFYTHLIKKHSWLVRLGTLFFCTISLTIGMELCFSKNKNTKKGCMGPDSSSTKPQAIVRRPLPPFLHPTPSPQPLPPFLHPAVGMEGGAGALGVNGGRVSHPKTLEPYLVILQEYANN